MGRVCPRCVFAGEDGLKGRMLAKAGRLKEKAERLKGLADEGVRIPRSQESVR